MGKGTRYRDTCFAKSVFVCVCVPVASATSALSCGTVHWFGPVYLGKRPYNYYYYCTMTSS